MTLQTHSCPSSLSLWGDGIAQRQRSRFTTGSPGFESDFWKKRAQLSFFSLRGRLLPPGLCRSLASRQMSLRPLPEPRWSSADGATSLTRATSLRIWRQLLSPGTSSLHSMQKKFENSWSHFCPDERYHRTGFSWTQVVLWIMIGWSKWELMAIS